MFTQEYKNPVNAAPTDYRSNLREAARLLKEAGWNIVDGKLQNAAGEALTIEFLIGNEQFQRVILPYVENLKRLGITPQFGWLFLLKRNAGKTRLISM